MTRPIRLIYVGDAKAPEWGELWDVADHARYHNNGNRPCEIITVPSLVGDIPKIKKARNLISNTDYFYFPSDEVHVEEVTAIKSGAARIFLADRYKELYRELNKKITRRLDGNMCVPCRVLDRKIVRSDVVHHLVFGEHVIDHFTNMMTVCQDIPMSGATCHGRFHNQKIRVAWAILSELRAKLLGTPAWRWEQAYRYYEKRR